MNTESFSLYDNLVERFLVCDPSVKLEEGIKSIFSKNASDAGIFTDADVNQTGLKYLVEAGHVNKVVLVKHK